MSAVNVSAIFIGFLLVSIVTNRVSLEEDCLPSFEVLNCLLNLAASCLDDENEIPLMVIASFSVVRFVLPSIPLIVLHSLVRSVFWSMFSTKYHNFVSSSSLFLTLFMLACSIMRFLSLLLLVQCPCVVSGRLWSVCEVVVESYVDAVVVVTVMRVLLFVLHVCILR